MKKKKTIIFLGDGMADEPIASLGGKTPLQAAHTPAMDRIARHGRCGTLFTLPEAFPTSSDVANMSVLGCDLPTEFCGRGPLEAAGQGLDLGPGDIAFRLNLITITDGVLTDFSGGHLEQADAEALIAALNDAFGSAAVRFEPGVSYRNLLILSGPQFSADLAAEKPDDNRGCVVAEHLPVANSPAADTTVAFLSHLMEAATAVLEAHPINQRAKAEGRPMANGVWPWSGGSAGALRTLESKFGISSAVISAVDVINGLGLCLGMDVIHVDGATGYIDTNYEGKADAAIAAIQTHDLVYLHVEAVDEVSHAQDLEKKLMAIEDFDRRVVARVLDAIDPAVRTLVLPDHPVTLRLGKHTRTPVPLAIWDPAETADDIATFDEIACPEGDLGALKNGEMMAMLFGE
jgi:2,3-bisphosphoglycerate-independent phosphoglycerate mutase